MKNDERNIIQRKIRKRMESFSMMLMKLNLDLCIIQSLRD